MLIAPGNINRDIQSSHVIHKVWGLSQVIVHMWIKYVILGNFTEQNASQNLIRQGAGEGESKEPIQLSGVHGRIIKSGSQSPKSGHKTIAIINIPHQCCSKAWVTTGPCTWNAFSLLSITHSLDPYVLPKSSWQVPSCSLCGLGSHKTPSSLLTHHKLPMPLHTHTSKLIHLCV